MNSVEKVQSALKDSLVSYDLQDKKLVVGFSGGADSFALLDSLINLSTRFNLQVHGAHINHSLVGESDETSMWVEEVLRGYGIYFSIFHTSVEKDKKRSEEDSARRARYRFLSETAQRVGADAVVIGHTSDDQAETILSNIIRGCGVDGLVGMRILTRGRLYVDFPEMTLFRPLLTIRKSETMDYCHQKGLSFLTDPSNDMQIYQRNRIRHTILSELEKLNHEFVDEITQLSLEAGFISGYLQRLTTYLLDNHAQISTKRINLRVDFLLSLQPVIQKRLIREIYRQLTGSNQQLNSKNVELAVNWLLRGQKGQSIDLKKGVVCMIDQDEVNFNRLIDG